MVGVPYYRRLSRADARTRIILITCHTGVTDRIILSCVRPPIRRGEFELDLCSFGVGRTTKPIDHSLDMRSFRIVERVTKVGVHLGWYWAVH